MMIMIWRWIWQWLSGDKQYAYDDKDVECDSDDEYQSYVVPSLAVF